MALDALLGESSMNALVGLLDKVDAFNLLIGDFCCFPAFND